MNRFFAWILVFGLFAIVFIVGVYLLRQRLLAGQGMPEYSVFSREDNGMATAADVLRRIGFEPIALTRPIQNTRYEGLLIIVEPEQFNPLTGQAAGLSESATNGILRWVEAGNTVVLATSMETLLHEELGLRIKKHAGMDEGARYLAECTEIGGYTEPAGMEGLIPVHHIVIESRNNIQGTQGPPLWSYEGKAGAWIVPYGQGRVIAITDPTVWTHRSLAKFDNVALLYNIAALDAKDGRVYFDEYHHGIRSTSSYWDYLRYHDLQWAVVQLAVVLAIGVWAVAVRLGPPLKLPPPVRADTVDYASAIARIYERAGLLRQMAAHLARDFLDGLTRMMRLRRQATTAEVLATWRKRHPNQSDDELKHLLQYAEVLKASKNPDWHTSKRALLHAAKEFDAFLSSAQG